MDVTLGAYVMGFSQLIMQFGKKINQIYLKGMGMHSPQPNDMDKFIKKAQVKYIGLALQIFAIGSQTQTSHVPEEIKRLL